LCALCLGLFAIAARAGDSCVVLQYHHFSTTTPAVTSVTPAQFDAHLKYLEQQRFHVLPLRELVQRLKARQALPERCVSLSVDDAYRSVYEQAYPRLKALGWPFTVFVSSAAVDHQGRGFMSWTQMREMARNGVSFENHSHSHAHLIRRRKGESQTQWEQRVRGDIERAQRRITQEIGNAPQLFAYPYGEFTPALEAIVGSLGLSGFGQQSGPVWPDADLQALPRYPMNTRYARLDGFRVKVNSLPMPLAAVSPRDPLLALDEWRPTLRLRLLPGSYRRGAIHCFVNGSRQVDLVWPEGERDELLVTPRFDLPVGRSRTNCTMPSGQEGRFRWYSHGWIRRRADGGWYRED